MRRILLVAGRHRAPLRRVDLAETQRYALVLLHESLAETATVARAVFVDTLS